MGLPPAVRKIKMLEKPANRQLAGISTEAIYFRKVVISRNCHIVKPILVT